MNRTAVFLGFAAVLALVALFPFQGTQPGSQQPWSPPAPTNPGPAQPAVTASAGSVRLSAKLGAAVLPASRPSEVFARVDVQATEEQPTRVRGPVALAVVLDRSGSMSGQKLVDAKRAATELIHRLSEGDWLSVVHYGSNVTAHPALRVSNDTRGQLLAWVEEIRDDGGTNISAGMTAGFHALRRLETPVFSRRLILLSDGQPTEGITHTSRLHQLAEEYRKEGIAVSALGIGTDFNDQLMRGLATRGGGFYAFVDQVSNLGEILGKELNQAQNAVAQQVELKLTPAQGVEITDLSGFPFRREADGSVTLQIYDLAVAQSARVLAQLRVNAGDTRSQVLSAQLRYWNPDRKLSEQTSLSLAAARSDDAQQLASAVDAEVHADSLRVIGGRKIAEATLAYERGDRARAHSLFDNVRELFGSSAQALAGDIAALDRSTQALSGSESGSEVRSNAMNMRKNLSNFGVNNTY